MSIRYVVLVLGVLILIAALFGFGTFQGHSTANAFQPTPIPLPFPPKIPLSELSQRDAHKRADRVSVENLAPLADQPCENNKAGIYPCSNVNLLAFMPLSSLGGGNASSSWGWTDPDTHKEYALLGRSTGTSFVDISDPKAPIYIGNLPSHTGESSWRELKTYGYYALIVSDGNGEHGLQIFDLRQLRNVSNPPAEFSESAHYAGFDNGHTITVNPEIGYAYVNGSNTCSGGPHIVDIRDPLHPKFVSCFASDGYTHDSQCVTYHGPDTAYTGHELCFNANEDTLNILDVSDKNNLIQLARQGYVGAGYTHQGWLTDDHQYLVLDDEYDEVDFAHTAYTYIWDVRDLHHPQPIGTYQARFRAIDHNQYIVGDRVYQANYRAGLRVLDATNVAAGQLREVGYFDIFPADDAPNFNAAWNVYPFHANGVVTISGIEQGLFIVKVQAEPNPPPCTHKPAAGTLDSPPQNATRHKLHVRLKWADNACASNYKVIVREKTASGKVIIQKEKVNDTQFKTKKLEAGKLYQWTIRPCNAWGCGGGTSRSFTTQ